MPIALLSQARLAARNGIPLDIVIRRYFAGKMLLSHYVVEESLGGGNGASAHLQAALADQEAAFDRLVSFVTEEYKREEESHILTSEAQRIEQVRRLLAGELVDSSSIDYGFDYHHLGVIARFAEARKFIRLLAAETNSRFLVVSPSQEEVWAWLGTKAPLDSQIVAEIAKSICPTSGPIALGESIKSLAGWRLTHRQARAAFAVVQASRMESARYTDVVLVASAIQDPVLVASLQELYLSPLRAGRNKGEALRRTLRAYFEADRNSQSAASALGVSRQTVAKHLQAVETRLSQSTRGCSDLLDAALQLEELGFIDAGDHY